jgi:hypothetical protein
VRPVLAQPPGEEQDDSDAEEPAHTRLDNTFGRF